MTSASPEKLAYLQEVAAKWECQLELEGEVGFGRECVGIQDAGGTHYVDYLHLEESDRLKPPWWQPVDAYHKHPCLAVLGRDEIAVSQLYEWVRNLVAAGYTVETKLRTSYNIIDLIFHGATVTRLVAPDNGTPAGEF